MPPINMNEKGQMEFDPSKRIRASLGEEFVNNVEAEGAERLAQAMALTPVKNNGREYEEDNDVNIKDLFKKTKHTTEAGQKLQEAANKKEEANNANQRLSNVKAAEKRLSDLISKKPVAETIVREATGFGLKDSKDQKIKSLVTLAGHNVASAFECNVIEPIVSGYKSKDNKDFIKNVGGSIGYASVIDFATSLSANNSRIQSIFDKNAISASEEKIIASAIKKEKVKYAAEHTTASVILPALAKIGLTKVIGQKKIDDNKILKVATSFGTLQTIGTASLSVVRKVVEKKQIEKINHKDYSVVNDAPTQYYADLAKLATNHVINESINSSIYGTVAGSILGANATPFIAGKVIPNKPSFAEYAAQSNNNTTKVAETPKKPVASTTSKSA